jgi:hypothetical protein
LKIFRELKWIGLGARTLPVELRFALQTTWPGLDAGEGVVVERMLALLDHDLQFAVVCGGASSRIVEGEYLKWNVRDPLGP